MNKNKKLSRLLVLGILTTSGISGMKTTQETSRIAAEINAQMKEFATNQLWQLLTSASLPEEDALEGIKNLVKWDADINSQARGIDITPLEVAAGNGQLKIVRYLVEKGAKVDGKGGGGYTPLSQAASGGHLDVIKYLVAQHADVNTRNRRKETPLHVVAEAEGDFDAVANYLIANGAQVDAKDFENATPLHAAAKKGNLNVVKTLVRAVAPTFSWENTQKLLRFLNLKKVDHWNKSESTALDIAKEYKNKAVADYLTQIKKAAEAVKNPLFTALLQEHKADVVFKFKAKENEQKRKRS